MRLRSWALGQAKPSVQALFQPLLQLLQPCGAVDESPNGFPSERLWWFVSQVQVLKVGVPDVRCRLSTPQREFQVLRFLSAVGLCGSMARLCPKLSYSLHCGFPVLSCLGYCPPIPLCSTLQLNVTHSGYGTFG